MNDLGYRFFEADNPAEIDLFWTANGEIVEQLHRSTADDLVW